MTPSSIAHEAISHHCFPGAAVWLQHHDRVLQHSAWGTLGWREPWDAPVTLETRYDLASLTKLYTLTSVLIAARAAGLPLETAVSQILPGFDWRLQLVHLLGHSSGLGLELQELHEAPTATWLERLALAPLVSEPGTLVKYSCSNYFVAARCLEAVTGATLDELMTRHIFAPLKLTQTGLGPRPEAKPGPVPEGFAPTEAIDWSHGEQGPFWVGTVHDEAARSWERETGTCCGNAGLFAPAHEVAAFASLWMDGPHAFPAAATLHPDDLNRSLSPQLPEGTVWRGLGWQLDVAPYMGTTAPPGTAGHLGFTGPSLVLNRATGHLAVVLNNRVHPTRNGPDRLPYHVQWHDWMFAQA